MSSDEMTAAELRSLADGTEVAEAIARGEFELDYDTAGKVSLPPPPETEPMVMCGLRLPPSLYGRIKSRAEAQGKTWSELARQLLEVGLTEEDDDRKVSLAALRRAIAHVAQQSSDAA
ncbi:MAG TPA: hypothetical protein VFZ32_19605 [Micromonosporaceae bacterium]